MKAPAQKPCKGNGRVKPQTSVHAGVKSPSWYQEGERRELQPKESLAVVVSTTEHWKGLHGASSLQKLPQSFWSLGIEVCIMHGKARMTSIDS